MVTPLYELMVRRVLESRVVGTDDTVMPMRSPGAGKARKARMWVYVGDQDHPYNVFEFTLSRSTDGPARFLKGYKGTLVADAYGGYDGIVVGNQIVRAGCWAHARRKFVDAELSHPAIAAEAVGIIKTLYAVEERGRRSTRRRAENFAGAQLPLRIVEITTSLLASCSRHRRPPCLMPDHPSQDIPAPLSRKQNLNPLAPNVRRTKDPSDSA